MWTIRRIYRREKKTDLINQQITVSPDLAPTDKTADTKYGGACAIRCPLFIYTRLMFCCAGVLMCAMRR